MTRLSWLCPEHTFGCACVFVFASESMNMCVHVNVCIVYVCLYMVVYVCMYVSL